MRRLLCGIPLGLLLYVVDGDGAMKKREIIRLLEQRLAKAEEKIRNLEAELKKMNAETEWKQSAPSCWASYETF